MKDTKTNDTDVGLFLVTYDVVHEMPGAPNLKLSMTVNTVTHEINGMANITQALKNPDVMSCKVSGEFREISDVNGVNYTVHLTGFGLGIVNMTPILEVGLTLVGGWEDGTGEFSYRPSVFGPWQHVTGATVTRVQ